MNVQMHPCTQAPPAVVVREGGECRLLGSSTASSSPSLLRRMANPPRLLGAIASVWEISSRRWGEADADAIGRPPNTGLSPGCAAGLARWCSEVRGSGEGERDLRFKAC